jgi:dTDP-glucose 4,6-dehydratase
VRPFNTYGPRQSARAVIPTIITQLLNGKTDIELGALHPTRDFNFVDDTVAGFIAAAQSDKAVGETINLGSAFEISIEDTAKLIAAALDKDIHIISKDERLRPEKSEVERLFACNKKARALLEWAPQYAGVEGFKKGVQKTAQWFADPQNLSMYKADIYNV